MNFTLSRAQKLVIAGVVIVPLVLFTLYTWASLSYTYSSGDRAGYVQKFSKKGWLCKTWEGEMAVITTAATMQEKFYYTVRVDVVRVWRALTGASDNWRGAPAHAKIATVHTVGGSVFPGSPLAATMEELVYFTVRDDAVAARINDTLGKRVALTYKQHVGIPTSCFGDTEYFVSDVKVVE